MSLLKSTNGIVIMDLYGPLPEGYKLFNDPFGSVEEGGELGKRSNSSLKCFSKQDLITTPTRKSRIALPCDDISYSVNNSWEFFETYRQNDFISKRFLFNKPTDREISISGSYLMPSTVSTQESTTQYMFKPFFDLFKNFCNNAYAFGFFIQDESDSSGNDYINLGKGYLPSSFSISIIGGSFQDASWSASFNGPFHEEKKEQDPPTSDLGKSSIAELPSLEASNLTNPIFEQKGLRTMNTRDFKLSGEWAPDDKLHPSDSETPPEDLSLPGNLVEARIDLNIDWKKTNTFGSFYPGGFATYTPSPQFWSMENISGNISAKFIITKNSGAEFNNVQNHLRLIQGQSRFSNVIKDIGFTCIPSDDEISFDFAYLKFPSIDFVVDEAIVYSFEGVLYDGTTDQFI